MEYSNCKRMEDHMYVTELLHNAITKWYEVRSEIVKISKIPDKVYNRPLEIRDENKEKELDLLCKDFKQLNEEALKYVNHQIIKMVETYSEINCLRQELVNLQTELVDQFNRTVKV